MHLTEVVVNMDKAACYLSTINSERCARAWHKRCSRNAGPSHGIACVSQHSILMSLIFTLVLFFATFFFFKKVNNFKQKHTEPLRRQMNKKTEIFGGFSSVDCSPPKMGRWLKILALKEFDSVTSREKRYSSSFWASIQYPSKSIGIITLCFLLYVSLFTMQEWA